MIDHEVKQMSSNWQGELPGEQTNQKEKKKKNRKLNTTVNVIIILHSLCNMQCLRDGAAPEVKRLLYVTHHALKGSLFI